MPICHKRKFIFFHIPRCGGTSFTSYFNFQGYSSLYGIRRDNDESHTLHHFTATDLLDRGLIDRDTLQSYFKFTVIRDPFDRMVSDFLWQKHVDTHGELAGKSFAGYLHMAEKVIKEERYFEKRHYDHFRPMTDYCVHDGGLLVDDILLLEDIDNELLRVQSRIGPVKLPHKNGGPAHDELRTTRNMDLVYRLYACDKALYENVASLLL